MKDKIEVFSVGNLVRLQDLDPDFIFDLRYASTHNFMNVLIYKADICVANFDTAARLICAKNQFKKRGYRVKIFDIYRPISAQRRMHQAYPDPDFVSQPPEMEKTTIFRPRHLNGMSVDLTLVDDRGNELLMPSGFDDFTSEASLANAIVGSEAQKNATYLKDVMEAAGFSGYSYEWWHFDDVSSPVQPYHDICLTEFQKD